MGTIKKLVSQTAIYGLSQIVGRFVNYLLVPLYTGIFTTGEYGVVTLMYAYVALFNVLLTYGMETTFFRFANKSDNPANVFSTSLASVLSTSVVFSILFIGFSGKLASLIRLPEHPEYIIYFTLILALDAVSAIPFAQLRQQNRPIKFALVKNINIFSNILFNLYFLMLCPWLQEEQNLVLPFYNPTIGIGYVFISNLIASAITIPLLYKEFFEIRLGKFSRRLLQEMLVYALPMMVVGFAGMINETLDRTLITWFYPDPEVGRSMNGIYGANYKLAILMSLFIQAFRYAAEPFFFAHAKSSDQRTIYAQVMNYFVLVCLFLFLMVTLFIDYFQYFIGEPFREGLKVVPILLLANLFLGIYYNLSVWYKLSDQTNKGAIISLTGAAITLLLNFWWIPLFGYLGSAWATFFCYFGMMVICYLMGKKYYPIPYQILKVSAYIAFALVLFGISYFLKSRIDHSIYMVINSLLLVGFCAAAFIFERKNLSLLT